jgi:ribosome-associated protein
VPKLVVKKTSTTKETGDDFLKNTLRMADIAANMKAKDIKAYDVRGVTLLADSFLICTVSSEPQFRAITNSILDGMREIGVKPLHLEGEGKGGWSILDYGDIIVHIFREEARTFYDLDGFWGDAPEIPLEL